MFSQQGKKHLLGISVIFCSFLITSGHKAHETIVVPGEESAHYEVATFAGGSFWYMQPPFDGTKGVIKTVVGYAGGKEANPTYEEVALGKTGHVEAIQVTFDPRQVNYQTLLHLFWHNIDPTDPNGQFCDKGSQYHAVIFYHDESQKELASASKQTLSKKPKFKNIYTVIRPYTTFYPAEAYHQEYYKKVPVRYKFYRFFCGRDKKLKQLWKSEH